MTRIDKVIEDFETRQLEDKPITQELPSLEEYLRDIEEEEELCQSK